MNWLVNFQICQNKKVRGEKILMQENFLKLLEKMTGTALLKKLGGVTQEKNGGMKKNIPIKKIKAEKNINYYFFSHLIYFLR